jgi:exodeoxyribonuclease-3
MTNFPRWHCNRSAITRLITEKNRIMALPSFRKRSCTRSKLPFATKLSTHKHASYGQAVGSPAYDYKLNWFARLRDCLSKEKIVGLIVCGDFNVAPEDVDVHDPDLWRGAIMCSDGERTAFWHLCDVGLNDTLRLHHEESGLFSWWDYRMLSFPKNRGLRIDAILANEALAKKCTSAGIDREMRKGKEPSDHAPVWAEFAE